MATNAGDAVYVLCGCGVPVVLRKRDDGWFEFIGESFMRGFVNGEAIDLLDQGKREVGSFELK